MWSIRSWCHGEKAAAKAVIGRSTTGRRACRLAREITPRSHGPHAMSHTHHHSLRWGRIHRYSQSRHDWLNWPSQGCRRGSGLACAALRRAARRAGAVLLRRTVNADKAGGARPSPDEGIALVTALATADTLSPCASGQPGSHSCMVLASASDLPHSAHLMSDSASSIRSSSPNRFSRAATGSTRRG